MIDYDRSTVGENLFCIIGMVGMVIGSDTDRIVIIFDIFRVYSLKSGHYFSFSIPCIIVIRDECSGGIVFG